MYLYILFAYILSVMFRVPLLYEVIQTDFLWAGSLPVPLFTPDAGLHGFYAKNILSGVAYPLVSEYMVGYIIALFVTIFHVPIDWVMLLLPVFLAPLVVIPIILLSKELGNSSMGMIAALFTTSYFNFYTRTSLGYTDTDMLILLFPLLSIYFMIMTVKYASLLFAFSASLSLLLFRYYYHSSSSIILFLIVGFFLFGMFYHRKESLFYQALIMLCIPLISTGLASSLLIILLLGVSFKELNKRVETKAYYYLLLLTAVVAAASFLLDFTPYYQRAMEYFDKQKYYAVRGLNDTYYFLQGLNTVAESKAGKFAALVFQFNIYNLLGVFSLVGLVLLIKNEKYYSLLLVFLFLGSLTFFAGFRFSFYFAPAYGFGLAYLVIWISQYLNEKHGVRRISLYLTLLVLFFHVYRIVETDSNRYIHMLSYNDEKIALEKLSKSLSDDDKIISWWDYGWPLWYFTQHRNTLADNGAHGGPDSYMMSRILSESNQIFVANAAKFYANNKDIATEQGFGYVTPYLASKYDLNELFQSFYTRDNIDPKQDTYILLHRNMVTIFKTIVGFSNYNYMDINDKNTTDYAYRYFLFNYADDLNQSFLEKHNKVGVGGEDKLVNRITLVKDQKLQKQFLYDLNSTYYVILDNNEVAYITDDNVYNSFLFQALLLDNYDKELFEKVHETYLIKIFKVK